MGSMYIAKRRDVQVLYKVEQIYSKGHAFSLHANGNVTHSHNH